MELISHVGHAYQFFSPCNYCGHRTSSHSVLCDNSQFVLEHKLTLTGCYFSNYMQKYPQEYEG